MATGPIETHLHRSFNWENGAPGSREGQRGRSARCGNGLFAQCVRLRSEINQKVTLADLASEPFVLLDEGEQSLVLDAFAAYGLSPHVTSEVTDDYTIMAMVEEGLGVSMLYRRTVEGMQADIRVRPIVHAPSRDVVAAWRSWDTMPIATRRFIDYMSSHIVN